VGAALHTKFKRGEKQMTKVIANVKVFAAASVLFALASFYNLSNSSAAVSGPSLSVLPPASETSADVPAVAATRGVPRS
jgi:hypothetical protein